MKGKMAVVTHEVRGRARHSQEAMKKKSGEIVKSGGEKASKKVEHLTNRAGLIKCIKKREIILTSSFSWVTMRFESVLLPFGVKSELSVWGISR